MVGEGYTIFISPGQTGGGGVVYFAALLPGTEEK
jgi:hypothetical protein